MKHVLCNISLVTSYLLPSYCSASAPSIHPAATLIGDYCFVTVVFLKNQHQNMFHPTYVCAYSPASVLAVFKADSLANVEQAFARMKSRRTVGKIVLVQGEGAAEK